MAIYGITKAIEKVIAEVLLKGKYYEYKEENENDTVTWLEGSWVTYDDENYYVEIRICYVDTGKPVYGFIVPETHMIKETWEKTYKL